MKPDYRAIVAVILALAVAAVLLRYVWITNPVQQDVELVRMFKELLLVIVGVLAGYISRGSKDD